MSTSITSCGQGNRPRLWIIACAIAIGGCGDAAAPDARTPAGPALATASSPTTANASLPCDHDPAIEQNATAAIACAHEEYAHGNYDAADARADWTAKHFPYSKRAVEAAELRADILVSRGKFADAARAYAVLLRDHSTDVDSDAITRKEADASARAAAPTSTAAPIRQ